MTEFVLGIDAGGTSVRVAVALTDGATILSEVRGTAAADGGPEPLPSLIREAVREAARGTDDLHGLCAGITKISRTGVQERWEEMLRNVLPHLTPEQCRIVPDYEIAFHGAIPGGVGIAALVGTGSVFYGADGNGGALRIGGRGWEYGDEGSGAWLTTELIRRTLRALDGVEKSSPLTEAVCTLLETREAAALGEAARQRSALEGRGFLAPFILERARSGDADAVNLYVGAAGWIAAYCRSLKNTLTFPQGEPVTVAMVGGMWEAGELLQKPFRDVLPRFIPNAVIVPPDASPLHGALRLAARIEKTFL